MSSSLQSVGKSLSVFLEHVFGDVKEEKDPGNHSLVSITSVPGNIRQYALVETIFKCRKEMVTACSQHGFTKDRSCSRDQPHCFL